VVYQLGVMAALLTASDAALGVTPAEHLTLIFNAFVVVNLFNQVRRGWGRSSPRLHAIHAHQPL